MHEWNSTTELAQPQADPANKQTRQLQIALVLLLVALAVVIVKDRDFWFGADQAIESEARASEGLPKPVAPAANTKASVAQTATAKKHPGSVNSGSVNSGSTNSGSINSGSTNSGSINSGSRISGEPNTAASAQQETAASDSPVVATNRTMLPPLDVEVVAGDKHSTLHPGSNVTRVEIPSDSNRVAVATAKLATNAAEREPVTAGSVPELRQTVETTYPLLGQHTRVQGSVVLQAVVGADGTIEDLRLLSGPAILSSAAEQAVRQWHFKPYLQNGRPVETKARITVNFSIRVSDNSATS
ncbi:MAG: TonB family protein [Candidatus Sulfotelmatobacter sp.]|jgi:TonB family protein